MLCLDEATVCKPLLTREKAFYENLPDILKPFTAQVLSPCRLGWSIVG